MTNTIASRKDDKVIVIGGVPGRLIATLIESERQTLIAEFLEDLHEKDNKIDCGYRCGGKPGEPCKHCTNYKYCDDNNYPIIKKWEERLPDATGKEGRKK